MKKSLFAVAFLALSSCDRVTDLQPQDQPGVPTAVVEGLKKAFPEAQQVLFSPIEKDKVWAAEFNASGAVAAALSQRGELLNAYRQVAETQLPDVARQTLRTQQPGASVQSTFQELSAKKAVQGYVAVLKTPKGTGLTVYFDPMGTQLFLLTEDKPAPATTAPITIVTNTYLPAADLPEAIRTYLSLKYPGAAINKCVVSVNNGKKMYYVYVTGDSYAAEAYFDEAGNLLKTASFTKSTQNPLVQLTASDLSDAVKAYLDKTYPGWVFMKAGRDDKQLLVAIQVGTALYMLTFDVNGTFISVQKI